MIKKLKTRELAKILGGKGQLGSPESIPREIIFDTRRISNPESSIFFALNGHRDGHEFISDAQKKGVKDFVISRPHEEFSKEIEDQNLIQVDDPLKALQTLAKDQRNSLSKTRIIGITGSNGKTIVKEWLWNILSSRFDTYKNPKSFNSQIGLPYSVLNMDQEPELAIFEAGISTSGEMENLKEILNPELGIFTTLGPAHNEGFGSEEEKLGEKLKLFEGSQKVIARGDRSYSESLREKLGEKLILWGTEGNFKYRVTFSGASGKGTMINVNGDDFEFHFGDHGSLENISHCIVFALEMGMNSDEIRASLGDISGISMRMDLKKGYNACWLINDSYNLDFDGLKLGLQSLSTLGYTSDKSLIMTDIPGLEEENYDPVVQLINQVFLKNFVGIGPILGKLKDRIEARNSYFVEDIEDRSAFPDFENETILLTGARKFNLDSLVPFLEERVHGTVLEIDLEAVQHNLRLFQGFAPESKMMVMVKGSGYGIGMTELAKFLDTKVDHFGVAYLDEGLELKKQGIKTPIMVMNPSKEGLDLLIENGLEAEVFDWEGLHRIIEVAEQKGIIPGIHINIDTGMHRLGFAPEDSEKIGSFLKGKELTPRSIFSHLSSADDPREMDFTKGQIERFRSSTEGFFSSYGKKVPIHICNTSGIINNPEAHFDMVRLGIGLYGVDPTGIVRNRLSSVARLITEISQVKKLEKGSSIGYSRSGRVDEESYIATLPIGYADGFPRLLGNERSKVFIHENPYPVIGNVCMDMIMVNLGRDHYPAGTPVEIFGKEFSLEQYAEAQGTIPYEVLTQIGPRVKRIYISSH